MSRESIQETNPNVKRKTRRAIPPGVALTLADIQKLSKRAQGPKKNPAVKIKRAFQSYIERCPAPKGKRPGLTSTTKRVACFLVDWYRLRDGYARPPISRIAEELVIDKRSAERAVATLDKLKLIFVKSGGPTRREGFGTIASRYVPNFWLVINRETGEIIRNAKYDFIPPKPIDGAGDYRQNDDRGAYRSNAGRVGPLKPIQGAGDYRQDAGRYVSTKAGADATPDASADATATASATRQEKQLNPLPANSEKVKIRFIQLSELASGCYDDGLDPEHLIEIVGSAAEENYGDVEFLRSWCENGNADTRPPINGTKYSHIILYGNKNPMTCEYGNAGDIAFYDLKPADWVAVEYRI